ncbi:MAG: helix-turn-helix transcriptional regulator, partial [Clostridia bacterium]|nr:helix-turn-helix transcriptional regulator [Clostridia bacterium]
AVQNDRQMCIFIYDVLGSAGLGSFLDSFPPQSVMLWVNEITDREDYVVRVLGDSMEPRLFDGDIVIIESYRRSTSVKSAYSFITIKTI